MGAYRPNIGLNETEIPYSITYQKGFFKSVFARNWNWRHDETGEVGDGYGDKEEALNAAVAHFVSGRKI